MNKYEQGLDKNAANFAALTPLNFIERAASVYPDQASIIHVLLTTRGLKLTRAPVFSPRRSANLA